MNEEEKRLNRQINYTIMNRIWMENIRTKDDDRKTFKIFYSIRPLNENNSLFVESRFYKAMNTGRIQLSEKEQKILKRDMLISPKIFLGEERFVIDGIDQTEWEKFKNWTEKDDSYNELAKKVFEAIDSQNRFDKSNGHFFNLCRSFYLRSRNPHFVIELLYKMSNLSFKIIDECQDRELQFYQSELEHNLDMVQTILKYRCYSK